VTRPDRVTLGVVTGGWLTLLVALLIIAPVWVLVLVLFEALTVYALALLALAGRGPLASWQGLWAQRHE
jgi:hypothetical protein